MNFQPPRPRGIGANFEAIKSQRNHNLRQGGKLSEERPRTRRARGLVQTSQRTTRACLVDATGARNSTAQKR
eukprot:5425286-Pyramimonas_sp.AAC.1